MLLPKTTTSDVGCIWATTVVHGVIVTFIGALVQFCDTAVMLYMPGASGADVLNVPPPVATIVVSKLAFANILTEAFGDAVPLTATDPPHEPITLVNNGPGLLTSIELD
jgi:hypothetical protein